MKSNINFLTVKKKEKGKDRKGLLIVRIAAVCCLLVIGVLSVSAFYLSRRVSLDSAKKNEASFLDTMAHLRSREAKLLLIKSRINDISEIISRREQVKGKEKAERVNYEKLVKSFKDKIPEGMIVNTLSVEETSVVLNLSSDSLESVDLLIDSLSALGQKKIISSLILDSLSLSEDKNRYSILLTATL